MESTAYIAISREMALREQMDLIANNLANVNTPGFKGEQMLFAEFLDTSDPTQPLSYVQNVALVRDYQPGPLTSTGNPLDLAIPDEGYFTVQTPDGPRYSRAGSFSLDTQGRIVTQAGQPLLDAGARPIQIPPGAADIAVSRNGTVSTELGEAGRIALVEFDDEQALKKLGDGLYEAGDQIARPVQDGEIRQGMLEGSNVQGVVEMTRLIDTARSYDNASKLVDEEHRRLRQAIETLTATA